MLRVSSVLKTMIFSGYSTTTTSLISHKIMLLIYIHSPVHSLSYAALHIHTFVYVNFIYLGHTAIFHILIPRSRIVKKEGLIRADKF